MGSNQPPSPADVLTARSLLGLDGDATREQIQAAWKKALRLTHPDLAPLQQRSMAQQLSQQINEAREILLADVDRRTEAPPVVNTRDPVYGTASGTTYGTTYESAVHTEAADTAHDGFEGSAGPGTRPRPSTGAGGATHFGSQSGPHAGWHETWQNATADTAYAQYFEQEPDAVFRAGYAAGTSSGVEPHADVRRRRRRTLAAVAGAVVLVAGLATALWLVTDSSADDVQSAERSAGEDASETGVSSEAVRSAQLTLADRVRSGVIEPSAYEQTKAVTAEDAFRSLTIAVEQEDARGLQGLLDPSYRRDSTAEIVDLMSDTSLAPWRLQKLRNDVTCRRMDDPAFASCSARSAADIIPYEVEFHERPGGWRLVGWST